MISFPNAKINIGLFITHKRSDGYHSIESIFYPVPIKDVLEIGFFNETRTSFNYYGKIIEGDSNQNLIAKAVVEIEKYLNENNLSDQKNKLDNLSFHLYKNIPTGAGLGGGSSDGSFALKMIDEFLELKIPDHELEQMALNLGSDCPFFIRNSPSLVWGRGEKLDNFVLDLSGLHLILIHPGIHVSTAAAYKKIIPQQKNFDWHLIKRQNIPEWKNILINDFEKSAFADYPEIKKIKEILYDSGAIYAQMSGSGSAVYGIFNHLPENIHSLFPDHYRIFTCEL